MKCWNCGKEKQMLYKARARIRVRGVYKDAVDVSICAECASGITPAKKEVADD